MSRFFLSLVFWLVTAMSAYADVYISPSGSDSSGTGVIGAPYRTVQAGIDALALQGPGNTLYLRGGTYTDIPLESGSTDRYRIRFTALNNATSWDNCYTIRSYPGEWAVIDASGITNATSIVVLFGVSDAGTLGFVEISHLEIAGARGSVNAQGIFTQGGPFRLRYLYVHDNRVTDDCTNPGGSNPSGINFSNGVGQSLVEYCHLARNGWIGDNENCANIALYSDYKYSNTEDRFDEVELVNPANGFTTARHSNIVRYNYIDGGDGDRKSGVGIKDKAPQFLASNPLGQAAPVDVNGWSDKGNQYHHNIIRNHHTGIINKTDFDQVYSNIILGDDIASGLIMNGVSKGYRGPWKQTTYNNTIIDTKGAGILLFNDPDGQSVYFAEQYSYNNLISGSTYFDSNYPLALIRMSQTAYESLGSPSWDTENLVQLQSNYFYDCIPSEIQLMRSFYTPSSLNALANSSGNAEHAHSDADPLYTGSTGTDQYKLNASYSDFATLSTGGRGGAHPYLAGVNIPSYIGAVNPSDDAWVDGLVTDLTDTTFLATQEGDPVWVEAAATSGDVYVATTGDDTTGDGSIANPYKTPQKGVDALAANGPGNTLYFRGGVYYDIPSYSDTHEGINLSALNQATSWDNCYTIRSYPGEWAIFDGSAVAGKEWMAAFRGATSGGLQGYIKFTNFEIRNLYGTVGCGGIIMKGGPYICRFLYVHDNTCAIGNNNPAGIIYSGAVGDSLIEYCAVVGNGHRDTPNENAANIALLGDYIYGWGGQELRNVNGFTTARFSNVVRYCYINGIGSGSGCTSVGIKEKGPQFLCSNAYGEAPPVDENNWISQGSSYHHNVIENHRVLGIYNKTDFGQIHHNIIDQNGSAYPSIAAGTSGTDRRGPDKVVIYNNTVKDSNGGIVFFNAPQSDTPTTSISTLYATYSAYNNLLSDIAVFDNRTILTLDPIGSGSIANMGGKPSWDVDALLELRNNYAAGCSRNDIHFQDEYIGVGDLNSWANSGGNEAVVSSNALYAGAAGADQYTLNPSYPGYSTLSSGGRGGSHPYLSGTNIPTYIGAVAPTGGAWVSGVMTDLLDTEYLRDQETTPTWAETTAAPTTAPIVTVTSNPVATTTSSTVTGTATASSGRTILSVTFFGGVASVSGTDNWTLNCSQLPVGATEYILRVTDNTFEATDLSIFVVREDTSPTATLTSSLDTLTDTATVTGTSSAYAERTIISADLRAGTGTLSGTPTNWALAATGLVVGNNDYSIEFTDDQGASTFLDFTIVRGTASLAVSIDGGDRVVTTATVTITGSTANATGVICEEPAVPNNGTVGSFSFEVPLTIGENLVTITATDGTTDATDSVVITRNIGSVTGSLVGGELTGGEFK